jgi:ribosomal protein L16 Arg81 hydroxylase
VVLEPGDVLYLPEGCWHRAAAEGSSLALTLACNRATPLDLVQQVLGPRLAALPALQCNLSGVATAEVLAEGTATPEVDAALETAVAVLRESVANLSASELRQALLQLARRNAA